MNVAIIKYNAGNTRSVQFALERFGVRGVVTDDPDEILSAAKVIIPGVGEARSAMNSLKEKNLDAVIKSLTQPVLGICLGMQILCRHSTENETNCLGIFDTNVIKFPGGMKVPHVGWNEVKFKDQSYDAYFVHSYFAELCTDTVATTDYFSPFSSILQKDNFYGVQFHPEKSGEAGDTFLKNFLML